MRTIFLILIFFFIFAQKHAYTEPKIIKKISGIENFTFDFEQLINDKKETGNCIISFNNKMMCKYDETGKLIVSNGKTLLIKNKRFPEIGASGAVRLADDLKKFLKKRKSIDPTDPSGLFIRNVADEFERSMQFASVLQIIVTFVGIGTLIAGIIGISNIMVFRR